MIAIFDKELEARIRAYPDKMVYANRLYANALKGVGALEIEKNGDVLRETEKFQTKLREYEVALKICLEYSRGLLKKIGDDTSTLNELLEQAESSYSRRTRAMKDALLTLNQLYSTLLILKTSCEAHQQNVAAARRALKTMCGKPRDLAFLANLALVLRGSISDREDKQQ